MAAQSAARTENTMDSPQPILLKSGEILDHRHVVSPVVMSCLLRHVASPAIPDNSTGEFDLGDRVHSLVHPRPGQHRVWKLLLINAVHPSPY